MKVSEKQLRRIIREEINRVNRSRRHQVLREQLDPEMEDELLAQLFPDEDYMVEAIDPALVMGFQVGLGTILGGVAALYGVAAVQRAWSAIKAVSSAAGEMALEKLEDIQRERGRRFRDEVFSLLGEMIEADSGVQAQIDRYRQLVEEVISIKGKRGKEYAAIRAEMRRVSGELNDVLSDMYADAFDTVATSGSQRVAGYDGDVRGFSDKERRRLARPALEKIKGEDPYGKRDWWSTERGD